MIGVVEPDREDLAGEVRHVRRRHRCARERNGLATRDEGVDLDAMVDTMLERVTEIDRRSRDKNSKTKGGKVRHVTR